MQGKILAAIRASVR